MGSTVVETMHAYKSRDTITILEPLMIDVEPNYFHRTLSDDRFRFIKGDVADMRLIWDLVNRHDVIIYMASLTMSTTAKEPEEGILVDRYMVEVVADCCSKLDKHMIFISTCSFASTKHITATGQGGVVCCDSKETFDRLVRLTDHGRNDHQSLKPMSDNYDIWGMNFKMTEIQTAFGLAQLRTLPVRRLQQIFSIYKDTLGDKVYFDDELPQRYVDIFTTHAPKIVEQLKKKKIHCRLYPRPLHLKKVASSSVDEFEFANTKRRRTQGLYLPSTTNMSDEDVMYVAQEVTHAIS